MLPEKITISIISPIEDDAVYINSTLRNAGITVHSMWSKTPHDCLEALNKNRLHLIFMRTKNFSAADEKIIDQIKAIQKYIPVIMIHEEVNQKTLTICLQMGAHDLISMEYPDRLTILTCRELGSYLKASELLGLRNTIGNYEEQLQALKSESTMPTLILIDGIIVEANRAAIGIFAENDNDDLQTSPILDFVHPDEQVILRGALKTARQGIFNKEKIVIRFKSRDLSFVRMNCILEPIVHDNEECLRLCLKEIPAAILLNSPSIEIDPLTKIYHRKKFIQSAGDTLQEELESGIRALLYIKIDDFKDLQDRVGLLYVDKALEHFAQCISETIVKGDIYARFGGNTFAILTQKGSNADVESWTEYFQNHLKQRACDINNKEINLTCSIGIAIWQHENDQFDDFIQRAKKASQEARIEGVGQIKIDQHFEEITKRSASFDIEWVARIKHALLQNRFQLFQFPISSLRMTSKNMIDVYIRMLDEDNNVILPTVFMPTAERNNLVKSLDRWVIGASIRYCQQSPDSKLFVRLSKQSLLDKNLLSWCNKIIQNHKIIPSNLVFEAVEEDIFALEKSGNPIHERLKEYRHQGYGVAIEHFGKHPAHIQLLEDYEVDYVKIDSTLIQGLSDNRDRQKMVKTLCKIANNKKVATIAEHVETADSMAVLYQLGADYMQGKFTLEPEVILGGD